MRRPRERGGASGRTKPRIGFVSWAIVALAAPFAARYLIVEFEDDKPHDTATKYAEVAACVMYAVSALLLSALFYPKFFSKWWTGYRKLRPGWRTKLGITVAYLTVVWFALVSVAFVNAALVQFDAAALKFPPDCEARHRAGQRERSECVAPRGGELFSQSLATESVDLLDGVPVLDISDSLRLTRPLDYEDRWTGIVQMLFKFLVIAQVFAVLGRIRESRATKTASAETIADEEAAVESDPQLRDNRRP